MKKLLLIILFILFIFTINQPNRVKAEVLELNSPSAVLMEPISKKVIYSKNPHKKLYPASMTKMMGLYLILEAIENNKISFLDEVIVSKYAASMGGTQLYLEENEKMSVEDLFKSVAINSCNDAIVALGEYLCGSNTNFVKMMNDKAKEFQMNDTHFNNATGFDDEDHYSSAYDMALLGSYLVSFDQKILKYTSMQEGYVREDSKNPFWLVNTNKLLKYYQGMDGLKTGFTQKAGYNLTSTAIRNGVRLISTVMNNDTISHRSQDTIRLLDYGFSKLKAKVLFLKDDIVSTYILDESLNINLYTSCLKEVKIIIDKDILDEDISYNVIIFPNNEYIEGNKVGLLEIKIKNEVIIKHDLYALNTIKPPSFSLYLFNYIKQLFV